MTEAPSEPIMFCHSEVFWDTPEKRRRIENRGNWWRFHWKVVNSWFRKNELKHKPFFKGCISGGRRNSSIINVVSSWSGIKGSIYFLGQSIIPLCFHFVASACIEIRDKLLKTFGRMLNQRLSLPVILRQIFSKLSIWFHNLLKFVFLSSQRFDFGRGGCYLYSLGYIET